MIYFITFFGDVPDALYSRLDWFEWMVVAGFLWIVHLYSKNDDRLEREINKLRDKLEIYEHRLKKLEEDKDK
jgi:hypothetical protein